MVTLPVLTNSAPPSPAPPPPLSPPAPPLARPSARVRLEIDTEALDDVVLTEKIW